MIKSLIKKGISACLLETITATSSVKRFGLKGFEKLSDGFQTFSGIKQGAPSSVILFIIFTDNVKVLKQKHVNEFYIQNLHHADDTLVFSFACDPFIIKLIHFSC